MKKKSFVEVTNQQDTLKLYAALALLLELLLGTLALSIDNANIKLVSIWGMIGIFVFMAWITGVHWQAVRNNLASLEQSLSPLVSKPHLPLVDAHASALKGVWRSRWFATADFGQSKPYLDDTITVTSVDLATGEIKAMGTGSYKKNSPGYRLSGRVSAQGLAHLHYQFPAPRQEKVGMVILKFDFLRDEATGYWLGSGRKIGAPDIGGEVKWSKSSSHGHWLDQIYDWQDY